jgi:hypothetical protein
MGATGKTCPKISHPTPQSIGITSSGALLGQPLKLMNVLHGQVREQAKKSQMDEVNDYRFPSGKKHL